MASRFRRVLTFGDVLDESVLLFRQHWLTFALVSAISLIPPGLLVVWLSATGVVGGPFNIARFQEGDLSQEAGIIAQLPTILASSIVSVVFGLVWAGAVVSTAAVYLRGGQPGLLTVYRQAVRRFFSVLLGAIVFGIGMLGLGVLATVLLVVTLFGLVGSVVAGIALLFWCFRVGARKTWVKWLIIATAPYGLPLYFSVRWSMFLAAAVLEGRGPVSSLRRSSALVDRQVFRVLATLTVSGVIVAVLVYAPAALVDIPLAIAAAGRGQVGFGPTEATISTATQIALQIFFASIGYITYAFLFFDLRNRRDGADLVDRLAQLEVSPTSAHG